MMQVKSRSPITLNSSIVNDVQELKRIVKKLKELSFIK